MTEKELRTWLSREGLNDAWFASFKDGEVTAEPLTLAQIRDRHAAQAGGSEAQLLVLHASQVNAKKPAWIEFHAASDTPAPTPAGTAAPTQRTAADRQPAGNRQAALPQGRSHRSSRRKRGMLLQLIVLAVIVIGGFALWYFSTTEDSGATITEMSPDEQIAYATASLERNLLKHSFPEEDPSKESLRTVISITQTNLVIKNSNLGQWPSLKLRFTTAKGKTYRFSLDEPVAAYTTLSISLRKIVADNGTSLAREDVTSGSTIELDIPGFHPWKSPI